MSHGVPCYCKGPRQERMLNWVVVHRNCNYSAFSGYHYTPSDFSAVMCTKCGARWRTKANYVYELKNKQ